MNFDKIFEENKEKDSGIRIADNWRDYGYASDKFSMPEHYKAYIDHVMIPRGLVMDRTEKMGNFSKFFRYTSPATRLKKRTDRNAPPKKIMLPGKKIKTVCMRCHISDVNKTIQVDKINSKFSFGFIQ